MNYSHSINNSNNNMYNTTDWSFLHNNTNMNINYSTEPLQEPVPFEDFQYSMGLDPEFALPIPLDIPPPPMPEADFFVESLPPPLNNAVLDEHDHKTFTQFLDQFFGDPKMQIDQQQYPMYTPPMPLDTFNNEEYRQNSILHSLDEQKKYHHRKEEPAVKEERSGAVYLQQSNAISAPYTKPIRDTTQKQETDSNRNNGSASPQHGYSFNGNSSSSGGAIRRTKPHKELLTEEEKRNNHIASEQKRRSMIRSGFKDLTEIVPTLKNINNSKSTVLFKAVDYIKYLDKRNRSLRDKIKHLEVRVEVQGRMGVLGRPNDSSIYSYPRTMNTSISSTTANNNHINHHNNNHTTALLQHKTQQRQLIELQEKLQLRQKMISQQQKMPPAIHDNRYRFDQPRWLTDSSPEAKMEVDASGEPLKATVSA
ncbi:hypothetical protein BDB01DRAFT_786622 [Pilobolus umbonatus]|nr:hypothetical protein BDB01DRAFT_786622 [Pilobolus umbonatus]